SSWNVIDSIPAPQVSISATVVPSSGLPAPSLQISSGVGSFIGVTQIATVVVTGGAPMTFNPALSGQIVRVDYNYDVGCDSGCTQYTFFLWPAVKQGGSYFKADAYYDNEPFLGPLPANHTRAGMIPQDFVSAGTATPDPTCSGTTWEFGFYAN